MANLKRKKERRSSPSKRGNRVENRGRIAGFYFPRVKSVDENENVNKVFGYITKHKEKGITQKAIVDGLELPNSTVWYALVKLRSMDAVKFQEPKKSSKTIKAKASKVSAHVAKKVAGTTAFPARIRKAAREVAEYLQQTA